MTDSELIFVIAFFIAVAVAGLAWTGRGFLKNRIDRDAEFLHRLRHGWSPETRDAYRDTLGVYAVMFIVVLPVCLFLLPSPVLGFVVWLTLWLIPHPLANWFQRQRNNQINEQLPPTIRTFAGLCGAGLSPSEALKQLAKEAPFPLRYEYQIMSNSWQMGTDLAEVADAAYRRLGLESFRLLYSALAANRELGGNLVNILEQIADALGSQLEMEREVNSALAEGKMSVYGLLAAPPLMLLIIAIMDYDAVKLLFSTLTGLGILAGAFLLIGIGVLWAWRIAQIKL